MSRPGTEAVHAFKLSQLVKLEDQIVNINASLSRSDVTEQNKRLLRHSKRALQRSASRLRKETA